MLFYKNTILARKTSENVSDVRIGCHHETFQYFQTFTKILLFVTLKLDYNTYTKSTRNSRFCHVKIIERFPRQWAIFVQIEKNSHECYIAF